MTRGMCRDDTEGLRRWRRARTNGYRIVHRWTPKARALY